MNSKFALQPPQPIPNPAMRRSGGSTPADVTAPVSASPVSFRTRFSSVCWPLLCLVALTSLALQTTAPSPARPALSLEPVSSLRVAALQQENARLRAALTNVHSNPTPEKEPGFRGPRKRTLAVSPTTAESNVAGAGASDADPELLLSPAQVVTYAARALFFPAIEAGNPVRRAWATAGLDWHNLVRPVTGVPKSSSSGGSGGGATAEAALYRDRREVVKAQLLDLLLGYSRVGPSPTELARRAADALALAGGRGDERCNSSGTPSRSRSDPHLFLVAGDTTALPLRWLGDERGAVAAALIDETASLALRGAGGGTSDDPGVSLPPSLLTGLTALQAAPPPPGAPSLHEAFRRRVESPWVSAAADAYGGHPLPEATSANAGASADILADLRSPTSDPGPLAKFAACPVVADRCLVHSGSARECVEDELCGWCERPRGSDAVVTGAIGAAEAAKGGRSGAAAGGGGGGICVSRWLPQWPEPEGGGAKFARAAPVCEGPLHVVAASVPEWHRSVRAQEAAGEGAVAVTPPPLHALMADGALSTQPVAREACALAVTRSAPATFSLDGTSKMAYHFYTETASGWVSEAERGGGLGWLRVHAWVHPRSQPEFLGWLHLFSNACHRSLAELGAEGMRRDAVAAAAAGRSSSAPMANASAANASSWSTGGVTWLPQSLRRYPVCYAAPGTLRAALKAAASGTANAAGAAEEGRSEAVPLGSRELFGLDDPALAAIDHATGRLLGPSELQLEAPLVAVQRGMRLGARGLAAGVRALGRVAESLASSSSSPPADAAAAATGAPDAPVTPQATRAPMRRALLQLPPSQSKMTTGAAAFAARALADWSRSAPLADAAARLADGLMGSYARPFPVSAPWALGLWDAVPVQASVVLVSRKNKRFILNEPQLLQQLAQRLAAWRHSMDAGRVASRDTATAHALAAGCEQGAPLRVHARPPPTLEVATLEDMPLYEQVRLFRRATVLIGVHGSALINSPFMAPGGAVIQLVPYRLGNAGSFFQGPAQSAGLSYAEWHNPRLRGAQAVHHWHFADSGTPARQKELLQGGSGCCGSALYFSFFINQEMVVDIDGLWALVEGALDAWEGASARA